MAKRGVLHRDISWGNILCRPLQGYDISDNNEVNNGYIERVLCVSNLYSVFYLRVFIFFTSPEIAKNPPRSACLLIDLNHAIEINEDYAHNAQRLPAVVSGPMFQYAEYF
jgi:hypothetical protein